jgi:hypothetical protein
MLWRCGVVIFAVLATVQLAIEVFHAPRVLRVGLFTEQLFEGRTLRERGPTTFVVDSLPATSPLLSAGVLPGDRLRWDEPVGRWYNLAAGDSVSLTVIHGDASRRIDVTMPAARALPRHQVANYVTLSRRGCWHGDRRDDRLARPNSRHSARSRRPSALCLVVPHSPL